MASTRKNYTVCGWSIKDPAARSPTCVQGFVLLVAVRDDSRHLTYYYIACWSQCLAWFHSSSTSCHFLLHLLCTSLTVQVAESPRPQSSPAKPLAILRFLGTIRQHHRSCFTPLQLALSPLQLEAFSSTRLVESRRLQGLLLKSARRADCFGW